MHPYLTRKEAMEHLKGRVNGTAGAFDLPTRMRGDGVDFVDQIVDSLEAVLTTWHSLHDDKMRSDQARDGVEGQLAAVLHEGLVGLPAAALSDRDLWRYCSAYLYEFIRWRQSSSSTVTALAPYFGAAKEGLGRDCVPHRMFDRAHIAKTAGDAIGDSDPYALAALGASDVWKSHILRVANGNAPLVARELLTGVKSSRFRTDQVRPLVKDLRRVRSNVIFEVLDEHQARDLVERESERRSGGGAVP